MDYVKVTAVVPSSLGHHFVEVQVVVQDANLELALSEALGVIDVNEDLIRITGIEQFENQTEMENERN